MMNTLRPSAGQPRLHGDLAVAQAWLDALASGACDETAFLNAVHQIGARDADMGWDLLALVDQYHRRGKINAVVFRNLKSKLESQLLGTPLDIEVSIPLKAVESTAQAPFQTVPILPVETIAGTSAAEPSPPSAHRAREVGPDDLLRGRYRVRRVLGRGGTATVLEAVDQYRLDLPNSSQRVAIKLLHPAVAQNPDLLNDLRREFQHAQSLSHPNIIRVHEYDRDGDTPFFTMEYLSGLSLSRVFAARHQVALKRANALVIMRDVSNALAHAHRRGVVHGDLNPQNIFITDDGQVRVLDFGAAHSLQRGPWLAESEASEQAPVAAPRFASCQMLEGDSVEVRDDIFALACLTYLLLSGKHPFGDVTALQARTLGVAASRPRGLTGAEWRALRGGLGFAREQRPSDVQLWLRPFHLDRVSDRLPVLLGLLRVAPKARSRVRNPILAACALLLAAASVWWLTTNFGAVQSGVTALLASSQSVAASAGASLRHLWSRASDAAQLASNSKPTLPSIPSPPAAGVEASAAPLAGASTIPAVTTTPVVSTMPPPPVMPAAPAAAVNPPSQAVKPSAAIAATAPGIAAVPAPPVRAAAANTGTSAATAGTSSRRARIELAAETFDVAADEPAARIVVRRSGNLHGDTGFSWWTESGTAKPGQDFSPVSSREEHFAYGKSSMSLYVPIVGDSNRKQAKSFYIVINDSGDGVSLGRALAMVMLSPVAE